MTTLSGPSEPEQVPAALVSTNFFTVLDVKPLLGRGFLPEDSTEGHTNVSGHQLRSVAGAVWERSANYRQTR